MMLSKSALALFLLSLPYGRAQDPLMMAQQGLAAGAEAILEHQRAHPNEEVEGVILVHTEPKDSTHHGGHNHHAASEGAQQHAQQHEQDHDQHHRRHLFHREKGEHSNNHAEQGHAASRDDSGSHANSHEQASQGNAHNDHSNKNQDQGNSAKSHEGSQDNKNTGRQASDAKKHGRKAESSNGEVNNDHDVSMREDIKQTGYSDHDKNFVTAWEDMPNNVELTDANFEHETQATTGSTTGNWLFSYNFPPAKPVTVQGQLPEPAYWYDRNIVLGHLKPPAPVTLKRLGLSKSHEQGGNGLVFLQPEGTFHVLPHKEGTNLRWSEILDFCKNPSTTTTNNDINKAPGNKIAPMPGFLGRVKEMLRKLTGGTHGSKHGGTHGSTHGGSHGSTHGQGFFPKITTALKGFLPIITTALALLTAFTVYKSMTSGGNKTHKAANKGVETSKSKPNKTRVVENKVPQTKSVNKVEGTTNYNNVKQTQPKVTEVKVVKNGGVDNTTPQHGTVDARVANIEHDLDNTNQDQSYVHDVEVKRTK